MDFNNDKNNVSSSIQHRASATAPTTSVIEAFRELQAEVKVLEAERFEALREKEELRNRLLEGKRNLSLMRHQHELDATEMQLSVKATSDRLQRVVEDLRANFATKEDIYDSLQRKIQAQRVLQQSLQEDIQRTSQKLVAAEKTSALLRREQKEISSRTASVVSVVQTSPELHRKQTHRIEHTQETLQRQIDDISASKRRAQAKLSSLRSYVDLVMKINGELCETLLAREAAKREVLRLTRAISPPRYTWPKEVPYHDIVHAVNASARITAEAAVERAALKATESALTSVIKAISPPSSRKKRALQEQREQEQREREREERRERAARSRSPLAERLHRRRSESPQRNQSSYLDSDSEDADNDDNNNEHSYLQHNQGSNGNSVTRALRFSSSDISNRRNKSNSSNSSSQRNTSHHSTATTSQNSFAERRREHYHQEASQQQRANAEDDSVDEERRDRMNNQTTTNEERDEEENEADAFVAQRSHLRHLLDRFPPSAGEGEEDGKDEERNSAMYVHVKEGQKKKKKVATSKYGRKVTLTSNGSTSGKVKSTNRTKKMKKRKASSDVTGNNQRLLSLVDSIVDYNAAVLSQQQQHQLALSNPANQYHQQQHQSQPGPPASPLQRFLSGVRRKKSLQTVIARQAAITQATRLAAAATAASTTVKVAHTHLDSNSHNNSHGGSHSSGGYRHQQDTYSSSHFQGTAPPKDSGGVHSASGGLAFVPSSSTGASEFNMVASVSRASRATKELNAAVASRYCLS